LLCQPSLQSRAPHSYCVIELRAWHAGSSFCDVHENARRGALPVLNQTISRTDGLRDCDREEHLSQRCAAVGRPSSNLWHIWSAAENVAGDLSLPIGTELTARVNGKDYVLPMAIEKSSVAVASFAWKVVRDAGRFHADADDSTPPHLLRYR